MQIRIVFRAKGSLQTRRRDSDHDLLDHFRPRLRRLDDSRRGGVFSLLGKVHRQGADIQRQYNRQKPQRTALQPAPLSFGQRRRPVEPTILELQQAFLQFPDGADAFIGFLGGGGHDDLVQSLEIV